MADWSIVRFRILPDFQIEVGFADLSPRLSQGPRGDVFDALCDSAVFSAVFLEHGALTSGGIDLAPDAMHERIRATGRSLLLPGGKRVA